ncbi:MAG: hypothetical protein Q8P67_23780 [archaeon]|nr:hypothetical protein [archaeon]
MLRWEFIPSPWQQAVAVKKIHQQEQQEQEKEQEQEQQRDQKRHEVCDLYLHGVRDLSPHDEPRSAAALAALPRKKQPQEDVSEAVAPR